MCDIIICDSGIVKNQTDYVKTYDVGYGTYDTHGHGSSLIEIVHKINKELKIASIRILDENNEGNVEGLILALDKCLELDAKVICLALSIDQSIIENGELEEAIEDVYNSGKIVVAALQNRATYSIPAGYKEVIGVKAVEITEGNSHFYYLNEKIQCALPIEDFYWKSIRDEYGRLGGNSVACALAAEHVANIVKKKEDISFYNIEKLLTKQFANDLNYFSLFDIQNVDTKEKTQISKTINDIDKVFGIDDSDGLIISKMKNFYQFKEYLRELENRGFSINNNTFIRKRNVFSVDSLANYLAKQKKCGDTANDKK